MFHLLMVVCVPDHYITEDTNIASKFTPGFIAMFDKGFNVQDLFLYNQVRCVLPPFVRSKRQFTRSEVYYGKRCGESSNPTLTRVMGRLKEFRLLDNKLPITMIDICDNIWIIAAAIVNLHAPLVRSKKYFEIYFLYIVYKIRRTS